MSQPFRFGVQSFNADSGQAWGDFARKAEGLGYSALHLADHLLGAGPALTAANHPVHRSRACAFSRIDTQLSRPGDG